LIVARDHGFTAWSSIDGECDPVFELAVDAVVLGRTRQLSDVLAEHPDLVARRSAYGHRADGGTFDVLEMLKTSAHPHSAGVAAEIECALATS